MSKSGALGFLIYTWGWLMGYVFARLRAAADRRELANFRRYHARVREILERDHGPSVDT